MSHEDLQPLEYEDIQEMHATNRNDGGIPNEPNTFTQCPAYGPVKIPSTPPPPHHMSHDDLQLPVYEDIQELCATSHNDGGSPPDEPNMVAQYTFTQCPAYATTSQL